MYIVYNFQLGQVSNLPPLPGSVKELFNLAPDTCTIAVFQPFPDTDTWAWKLDILVTSGLGLIELP